MSIDMEMQIDDYWFKLVLRKLNQMMLDGSFGSEDGEVRYIYDWNAKGGRKINLDQVQQEDKVLIYFLSSGVIFGRREWNQFKEQQRKGNAADRNGGVWGKSWEEADKARQEYDWETYLHGVGVDRAKYEKELDRFNLVVLGTDIADRAKSNDDLLPEVVIELSPYFCIHKGNIISYKGHEIVLEPQPRRIATLVMERSQQGTYTQSGQIIDEILAETYREKAKTSKDVKRRVTDSMYELRSAFKTATGIDKNFFPNKKGVGYIFSP